MRLNALKLSQPTVSAYILFLIVMVMNFGLSWSSDQVINLFHDGASGYLTMDMNGRIFVNSVNYTKQNWITSADKDFILTIYNEERKRYVCFKKSKKKCKTQLHCPVWKLVGLRKPSDCTKCKFKEEMENGFHRYAYVDNTVKHYIAFRKDGNFSDRARLIQFMKKPRDTQDNETIKRRPLRHNKCRKTTSP